MFTSPVLQHDASHRPGCPRLLRDWTRLLCPGSSPVLLELWQLGTNLLQAACNPHAHTHVWLLALLHLHHNTMPKPYAS